MMRGMSWKDRIPPWLKRAALPVAPLTRAAQLWNGAGGMRMSAAMSFYGILSLAPLLLAIVALLGWWIDREVLEKGLLNQLTVIIGERGASVLSDALSSAKKPAQGIAASVAGFLVLLFGATGVFNELQDAFEQVWSYPRPPQPKAGLRHAAALRLRGIGYILVFGFLLLVSLVVSTLLSLFSGWAGHHVPLELALRVLNEVVAFAICAALFAGLMRLSGGARPRRRFLLAGACVGAILFTIGRQALAAYLAGAAVVSAYGAAGSLIVLLMWIYFSSGVLLYGAGCARALQEQAEQKALTKQGPALGQDQGTGGQQADGQQDQQAPAVAGGTRPHHA
ncbi:MAG: putative rane protein [Ramlibacter sp.]|nr:putative rane protein [Ramlibacter sp.]